MHTYIYFTQKKKESHCKYNNMFFSNSTTIIIYIFSTILQFDFKIYEIIINVRRYESIKMLKVD